jgi:hypothetical protein
MKFIIVSLLPFLLCPFICLNESKRNEVFFSLQFIEILTFWLILVFFTKKFINIKYFAYSSLLLFPITFVISFFIVFSVTDYKIYFQWLKHIPLISDIYIFIPIIIFHFFISFLLSKVIKKKK